MYRYRTKDKTEVDLVLENRHGQVVAIEVKAAATPASPAGQRPVGRGAVSTPAQAGRVGVASRATA
jgi:hypothetical protein